MSKYNFMINLLIRNIPEFKRFACAAFFRGDLRLASQGGVPSKYKKCKLRLPMDVEFLGSSDALNR